MFKSRFAIIIGVLVLALLLIFALQSRRGEVTTWAETYDEESVAPYGLSVLYNTLPSYFEGYTFVDADSSFLALERKSDADPSTYFFVGESPFLDSSKVEKILDFVDAGNTAFISSKSIPYILIERLVDSICMDGFWEWVDYPADVSDTATFFINTQNESSWDAFTFEKYAYYKKTAKSWSYLDHYFLCDSVSTFEELGYFDDSISLNFVRAPYGRGSFLLHTTPFVFTNLMLSDSVGKQYTKRVLAHIEPSNIIWDQIHKVDEFTGRAFNGSNYFNPTQSPLQYILSQPALAWAWYIGLALVGCYLIFQSRRKQRMIPVITEKRNTSLEFVYTIGDLYFSQNKHKQLAYRQTQQFLSFVRERYKISTTELDDHFAEQFATHAAIPLEDVQKLLRFIRNIQSSAFLSEKSLMDYHTLLEDMYEKCQSQA